MCVYRRKRESSSFFLGVRENTPLPTLTHTIKLIRQQVWRKGEKRRMQTEVSFSFLFYWGGEIERHPVNNIIAAMWHVIIAIQGLIIHIKQGEASLSFACLRLYAFEKSFPQGV